MGIRTVIARRRSLFSPHYPMKARTARKTVIPGLKSRYSAAVPERRSYWSR